MFDSSRILALSPHPDDVEYACGGLLTVRAEIGSVVMVATFSTCEESLPEHYDGNIFEEQLKALSELGEGILRLAPPRFQVRRFSEARQDILEALVELRNQTDPTLVLCPCSTDMHQDHRTLFEEASRAFLRRGITLLGYELPWNSPGFRPQLYTKLRRSDVDRKLAALRHYESQQHRPAFASDYIEATMRRHGLNAGSTWAEGFEVICATS